MTNYKSIIIINYYDLFSKYNIWYNDKIPHSLSTLVVGKTNRL